MEANGRDALATDLRELYCNLQELLNLMQLELEGGIVRSAIVSTGEHFGG